MKIFPSAEGKREPPQLNVFSHVSWLLFFNNESNKLKFNEFKQSLSSKYIFLVAYILTAYFFGQTTIFTYFYYPTSLSAFMLAFAFAVPILVGFIVLLIYYEEKLSWFGPLHTWAQYRSCFESVWVIGCSIAFALVMISVGANGLCRNPQNFGCNHSSVSGKMPEDIVFVAAVLPIWLSCAAKGTSWLAMVSAFFIGLFGALFTVFYYDLQIWWSPLLFFEVSSFVVLYEHQRQTVKVFLLTEYQSLLLSQIEKMAEETHAKELRSMISNVAHDLKTVSFIFKK